MNTQIPAVFSDGVFRPLVPVVMAEGTRVQVEVQDENSLPAANDLQSSWQEFLKEVESLGDDSPNDGLTNRDHDQILYGK
jgi:predicted DNA-binding antitoxin AbrB/MazE fold protein